MSKNFDLKRKTNLSMRTRSESWPTGIHPSGRLRGNDLRNDAWGVVRNLTLHKDEIRTRNWELWHGKSVKVMD